MRAQQLGTIALSSPVHGEIVRVLARPKLARIVAAVALTDLLDLLVFEAAWFDPTTPVEDCRDPNDNAYLELALQAQAAAIITGDSDLLVLHPWRGIPVLNSADFLLGFEGA